MQDNNFADWNGSQLRLKGVPISLLPDAHLGRVFNADVPLHRRGEREAMVMADFKQRMAQVAIDKPAFHICVGDLFDKPNVDPTVVLEAALTYKAAVGAARDTTFIVYPGNHDLSRTVEAKTSYDLFRAIVGSSALVLRDRVEVVHEANLRLGFVPWSPTRTAAELVAQFGYPLDCVFGHWDVVAIGDHRANLAPVDVLREIVSVAVTGHDHRARRETYQGLELLVTGSMQPYSHSEDQTGQLYRTVTLAELEALPLDVRRGLCLRVVLQPGDEMPTDIDALQVKTTRAADVEAEKLDVGFGDSLDMTAILAGVFKEFEVPSNIQGMISQRYMEARQ